MRVGLGIETDSLCIETIARLDTKVCQVLRNPLERRRDVRLSALSGHFEHSFRCSLRSQRRYKFSGVPDTLTCRIRLSPIRLLLFLPQAGNGYPACTTPPT